MFNPFPAGEERTKINTAWRNLINAMKDEALFDESSTIVFEPQEEYNVDIMKESDYNSYTVERKKDYEEGEIHASFTVQPSEFEQIRSEVDLYRKNEKDGLHYIDLSKEGYFSYIYKKQGNSIIPIVQLRGHEDVLNFVRRQVENGNYKEYGTARRWSSTIRSEYRSYNSDISYMQHKGQTDKNDVNDGRQNREQSKDNRRKITNRSEKNSTNLKNSKESSFSLSKNNLKLKESSEKYDFSSIKRQEYSGRRD